jgi:ketosteroid isomerase-like protein
MSDSGKDSKQALTETIGRYNEAWNAHDLDAIMAMHAPDMVFDNHTAGESASGEAVRGHIATIFENWPDLAFESRRLYVREGVVVQEWTAKGRKLEWDGVDVIPFEHGLIKRKDVYSNSASAKRQAGLG